MKIVHVSLRFDAPGGVETTVREVVRRLRTGGDEVEVFASDLVDEASWRRGTEFRPVVDGVPVRRFPVRKQPVPGLSLPFMVGLIDALADSGADVVHAHSHRYGHVLQAAAVARRTGIPLVVSTHYHPADAWEPRWKKAFLRLEDVGFGAGAYRTAEAIVVESRTEAARVGDFAPRERIRIVPPGIDRDEWAGSEVDRAVLPPLPTGYVLFAGRIAPNKGLSTLLRAVALLPPADRPPVVLAGPPWGEQEALERLATELRIEDRLTWLGAVPDPATFRAVVRGARTLVLPSAWEAFGLVLLAAMAARVPIVATSVGAVPEVLAGGEAGRLVPYGDPAALADALADVVRSPEATRAKVEAGTRRVAEFDWARSVERLRGVYREAVG